jgi:hypothetical protein
MLAVTGCIHIFSLYRTFFACIGRAEASASFLDQQRDLFNEKKVEAEVARRLLVSATKEEANNENQEDNSDEARLDIQSVW